MTSQLSSPLARGRPGTTAREDARFEERAARAAALNERSEHPEIVRRRYAWWRALVVRIIWAGMIVGLLYTMQNVQHFAATVTGAGPGDVGWWAAWLVEPSLAGVLIAILVTENLGAPEGEYPSHKTKVLKVALIGGTYAMNTWFSWMPVGTPGTPPPGVNWGGVVFHSITVLIVLAAAEVVTDCQGVLTRTMFKIVERSQIRREQKAREQAEVDQAVQDEDDAKAAARDLRKAREQADLRQQVAEITGTPDSGVGGPAPIGPPPAPAFQAVRNAPAPPSPPLAAPVVRGKQPPKHRPLRELEAVPADGNKADIARALALATVADGVAAGETWPHAGNLAELIPGGGTDTAKKALQALRAQGLYPPHKHVGPWAPRNADRFAAALEEVRHLLPADALALRAG